MDRSVADVHIRAWKAKRQFVAQCENHEILTETGFQRARIFPKSSKKNVRTFYKFGDHTFGRLTEELYSVLRQVNLTELIKTFNFGSTNFKDIDIIIPIEKDKTNLKNRLMRFISKNLVPANGTSHIIPDFNHGKVNSKLFYFKKSTNFFTFIKFQVMKGDLCIMVVTNKNLVAVTPARFDSFNNNDIRVKSLVTNQFRTVTNDTLMYSPELVKFYCSHVEATKDNGLSEFKKLFKNEKKIDLIFKNSK